MSLRTNNEESQRQQQQRRIVYRPVVEPQPNIIEDELNNTPTTTNTTNTNTNNTHTTATTRFSSLLNPIRNIADNFNIDIANELEQYLEELESITITLEDSNNNNNQLLNFAEAALLIQGSTLIYSKKVEILYQLVYNVLDHLKRKKLNSSSSIEDENNERRRRSTRVRRLTKTSLSEDTDEEEEEDTENLEFKNLMKEMSSCEARSEQVINLPPEQNQIIPSQHGVTTSVNYNNNNMFLNYDQLNLVDLSYEDSTRYSQSTNYKLSACIVHDHTGSLMFQKEDEQLLLRGGNTIMRTRQVSFAPNDDMEVVNNHQSKPIQNEIEGEQEGEEMEEEEVDNNNNMDYFGGDEVVGFDENDQEMGTNTLHSSHLNLNELILSEQHVLNEIQSKFNQQQQQQQEEDGEDGEETKTTTLTTENENTNIREYNSFMNAVGVVNLSQLEEEGENIWEPLDAHSEFKMNNKSDDQFSKKPFKLKRDFKIPSIQNHTKNNNNNHYKTTCSRRLDMASILSIRDMQRYLLERNDKLSHLFPGFTYEMTQYSQLNFNRLYHHSELNSVLYLEKRRRRKLSSMNNNNNKKTKKMTTTKDDNKKKKKKKNSSGSSSRSDKEEEEEDEVIEEEEEEEQDLLLLLNDKESVLTSRGGYLIDENDMNNDDNEMITNSNTLTSNNNKAQEEEEGEEFMNVDINMMRDEEIGFGGDDYYNNNNNNNSDSDNDENNSTNNNNNSIMNTSTTTRKILQSYEDLCKRHVERYMRSTDRYMQDAQLVYRVNDWESRLTPVLNEQNRRSTYDIHKYGEMILEQFSDDDEGQEDLANEDNDEDNDEEEVYMMEKEGKKRKRIRSGGYEKPTTVLNFQKIAQDKPSYEVCRLFLATLQLANMGNIEIHHEQQQEQQQQHIQEEEEEVQGNAVATAFNHPTTTFHVKLLSKKSMEQNEDNINNLFHMLSSESN